MCFLLPLAVVLALALAACGGEEGEEEQAGPAGQTIEVVGTDFALDPSTVTLEEPGAYTFRFVNDGETDHALEVEGHGVEEETEVIPAGETAEMTVEITEPGEYDMYCPVDGHKGLGMDGSVTLGGAAGGGGGEETTTEEEDGYGYG